MRIHSSLVLAVALSASLVCAENLTQANVEKAQAVIDAAVQAYGGEDKLSEMNTLIIEHETVNIAVGQSRSPEPPWDRNPASGVTAIDYGERVFVTRNSGTGGGFEFDNGTVIDGEDSYQLNFRAGTSALIAEPDFDTTSGPFMRITPALLVRQISDRAQNAYYLGEVEIDDDIFDVVGFSMAVGPAISLYFDRDTRLLKRSERVLPAFGLVEYRFNDYERVDGIPFNQLFEFYFNGDANLERRNLSTKVNAEIGKLAVVDETLLSVPAIVPDELSRQEIA